MPKITRLGGPSHEGFDEPPGSVPVVETPAVLELEEVRDKEPTLFDQLVAKAEPTPKVEVKAETSKTITRRPRS